MSKSYIYEPLPEGARPAALWWAVPQVILMLLIAIVIGTIGAVIASIIAISIAALNGSWDPAQSAAPPESTYTAATIGFMIGLFIGLLSCALMKIRMEKRSLASAGMKGFLYGRLFWAGFLGGIGIALLLAIPGILVGGGMGAEQADAVFSASNLLTGQFLVIIVCLLAFLMFQSPVEEIFIRGWLFSALTWRHGVIISVTFSSIVFALLHIDRLIGFFILGDPAAAISWGVLAMLFPGAVGVLFAALAYATRSVYSAAGMHTGYNFVLISGALSYAAGTSEDGDLLAALQQAIDISNLPDFELTLGTMVEIVVRVVVPIGLAIWLFRRKRAA